MLQPLQNEMNVLLTVSSLSTVEYCNTAILNIEVMTNIRGFFKTFNANIKQPCWEKVPDVPEPFFHMRGLGQQDVLKLLCNLVSIGIPDETFFLFSRSFVFKTLNHYWRRKEQNEYFQKILMILLLNFGMSSYN